MLPAQAGDDDPDIIRGIGGCSGKVTGKVKVILNPGDDMSLNGEILVAARTDPGSVVEGQVAETPNRPAETPNPPDDEGDGPLVIRGEIEP